MQLHKFSSSCPGNILGFCNGIFGGPKTKVGSIYRFNKKKKKCLNE